MTNSFGTKDEHRVKSLKGWFTITGRMGRKEYWSRLIAFFVVLVPCAIIQAIPVLGQIVGLVVGLTGYIAMTTVFVRRLHDVGASGWLALLLFIPPVYLCTWLALAFIPGNSGSNKFGTAPE